MKKRILFFVRNPFRILTVAISKLPYFSFIRGTSQYQNAINFETWFIQKVLNFGGNRSVYWPVHWSSRVVDPGNIEIGIDTCPGYMKGCYIQGKGGIKIGDYTQIAPNVVIVSSNHDVYDSRKHNDKKVTIGKYCWLGAGSKIMPGVELGDFTIVAAGAVVTKSFPDGHVVLGGVPAKEIRRLEKARCVRYEIGEKYYGYLNQQKFKIKFPENR